MIQRRQLGQADCYTSSGSYNISETNLSSFPVDADKQEPLDTVVDSEVQKNMERESESDSGIEYSFGPIASRVDEEIARTGSETNPIDEANSSFVMQNGSGEDSLPCLCGEVNHEKNNHLPHFEWDNNEASLNYVKDVLQLSGFIENGSLGKWYFLDQPLDPSLFKEMEADLHQEVQFSEEFGGNCDHQVLFYLINEVLLEMYERSFTYFPRAFSFNHSPRPMPQGHRALKEVWGRICWYLSFRSELDRSMDDIVAQDLSKGDGWMSHQFETECVALKLEELIFDELLDEAICS